jgi:hypothetical protein
MPTDIDNIDDLPNEGDNIVPEDSVLTAPRLDPDPVPDDVLAEIDALPEEPAPTPATAAAASPEESVPAAPAAPEPEVPVEPAPEVPVEPAPAAPELDPEIAAIEQPRNLSEANSNNWKKLQETASRFKREAAEAATLRQRVAELEARPVTAPADYEELRTFKKTFDFKHSEEYRSQYEQPIGAASDAIYAVLEKNGASAETIDSIKKAGGPDKISETWWKANVIDKVGLTDAEKVKQSLLAVSDLREKQEKEAAELASRGAEYLDAKRNEKVNWFKAENEQIGKHIDELTREVPWARFRETPAGATPEEAAQVAQHNAKVTELQSKFQSALWPTDARSRAEIAAAATISQVLGAQLRIEQSAKAALEARLKALETENSQLKLAGRAPKQSASVTPNKVNATTDRSKMSAADAIDMGLDEAGA